MRRSVFGEGSLFHNETIFDISLLIALAKRKTWRTIIRLSSYHGFCEIWVTLIEIFYVNFIILHISILQLFFIFHPFLDIWSDICYEIGISEIGEVHIWDSWLADTINLSRSPEIEIDLGELESIICFLHGF